MFILFRKVKDIFHIPKEVVLVSRMIPIQARNNDRDDDDDDHGDGNIVRIRPSTQNIEDNNINNNTESNALLTTRSSQTVNDNVISFSNHNTSSNNVTNYDEHAEVDISMMLQWMTLQETVEKTVI